MAKKSLKKYTIMAPCKINLHLEIGEKGPDGYHSLKSIFAALALADRLMIEVSGKEGDLSLSVNWDSSLDMPKEEIPLEKNLVFKALSLFREYTGFNAGLKVQLFKCIPSGAGLGGGSSDAAAALLAMNNLAKSSIPKEKLREMALLLGSDVPFFLEGGAAYVSGQGETVEPILPFPLSLLKLPVVLVKPPFSNNTASAFRQLDEARAACRENSYLFGEKASRSELISAFYKDPAGWPFYNDFLKVYLESKNARDYSFMLEALKSCGASHAGLSGSGSCCFGIFKSQDAALRAERELAGNFVRCTFFLA